MPPSGESDDDWAARGLVLSNPAAGLISVDARHADVQKHDVRLEFANHLKRGECVVGCRGAPSKRLDQHRHGPRRVLIVVDDEDAARDSPRLILAWLRAG